MKLDGRLFLKSVLFSIGPSIVLFAVAFLLLPQTWITQAYLCPGLALGTIFDPLIPTKFIYWLVPEGGGPAFVFIGLIGAIIFWLLLFAIIHYFWQSRRQNNSSHEKSTNTSKSKRTTCPHCSTVFNIDSNRAYTIDQSWFYDSMMQFENFSTVKCPECKNDFKAPEARLFGVFKSPYTVFVLSSLLGLMIVLASYFLFLKKS